MDRPIVYPSAIPRSADFMFASRAAMVSDAKLAEMVFGTLPAAFGLACTPTTPASLQVIVGQGGVTSQQAIDTTAYGSLDVDAHLIMKMGVLTDPVTLSCAAPGSVGMSINYLVQAAFSEVDSDPVLLNYYNSANPTSPWSGPLNAGSTNYTTRRDKCIVTVKAGTAATTGTQTTPAPDAGNVPLYAVTVANGQTTITAGNIVKRPTSPVLPLNLAMASTGLGAVLTAAGIAPDPTVFDQVLTALRTIFRTKLTGDTSFYVSSTGSDSAAGTSAAPWATLQHAWDTIRASYDLGGFNVSVVIADGTYAGVTASSPLLGQGSLSFIGNVATPSNCIVSVSGGSCFLASGQARFGISGFKLTASGTGGQAVAAAEPGSQILVGAGIEFGACSSVQVNATDLGRIHITANYKISGSSPIHIDESYGQVVVDPVTVTLTGTPNFSNAFVVSENGRVSFNSATFSGSATGARYFVNVNGVIQTFGAGATYLPGNSAGNNATGGVYA